MQEDEFKFNLKAPVLRPLKDMRSPPSLLQQKYASPIRYLSKLLKRQRKLCKKATKVLSDIPPTSIKSSGKISIKISRLSPYLHNTIKLPPIAPITPRPKPIKKEKVQEIIEEKEENDKVLNVSTKVLNHRDKKKKKQKKIEVGVDTAEVIPDDSDLSDSDDHYLKQNAFYLNKNQL
jgi:hypothetical protein